MAAAQHEFDLGLTFVYAFRREEAYRHFAKAAELDPNLAMAYWGEALAVGPNINVALDAAHQQRALAALAAAEAHASHTTREERALIRALGARYSGAKSNEQLAAAYRDEMRRVHENFPDDCDVSALYAEAALETLDMRAAWKGGTPSPEMADVVAALESALDESPENLGVNHLYIHAMEWSNRPRAALASAELLSSLRYPLGASHLIHMGSHIYVHVGDYAAIVRDGARAAADDARYAASIGAAPDSLTYYEHNLDFWLDGALALGDAGEIDRASALLGTVDPVAVSIADVDAGRWQAILSHPPAGGSAQAFAAATYARGMALVATGDIGGAGAAANALAAARRGFHGDSARLTSAWENVLRANIAEGLGDRATASSRLQAAVSDSDALDPDGVPAWYVPARRWLGEVLLRVGNARSAERVFRDDLERRPRDPRSLAGLSRSLAATGDDGDAAYVARLARDLWRGSPAALGLDAETGAPRAKPSS